MSRTEARTVVVRSIATSSWMAAGMEACNCGNSSRTLSTALMMFAPGWRKMIISTAGCPLASPALRVSSTESCTSATSPRRTALSWLRATMMFLYWSAWKIWSLSVICQALITLETSPLGRLALAEPNAARTCSTPIPSLLNSVGLSSARTAGRAPPPTNTCPTPGT